MNVVATTIPDVQLIEPRVFRDERGEFFETFQADRYREVTSVDFVQDNCSRSKRGVLRGLHYQIENPQAKLVTVLHGEIFDVAVDIRQGSPTFGQWVGMNLSGENRKQLYLPIGFAHGFCVVSESAEVLYKCSDFYNPQGERTIQWNDPELAIDWPVEVPILSPKDAAATSFADAPYFERIAV
ncbi:dTDP-4-dehydrorhamnose 3,5-epimerase [Blastopirellula sp. JC732]|uniref:dTDP-4-dehydrorhamnose 3,5-epimerase n=1 Tax=Blastopirellula sediminis TaxID=2894196 RepID=A0A9X1MM41_9BACT|nr:dTDP-4-dehydrorhamnose 3,5-epimerase [Blastopirellula sediminis]MCC9608448.1 dTDP-4-dehydrorhamnose 3,5-epimerase [Blastopirellula sediminis]MCC9628775.1 dTDP-4-dehydrorhamnose 3,5-epimerase [Blastopirellula sediminis]